MVRHKTVLVLILTLCVAVLVRPPAATEVALVQHRNIAIQVQLDLKAEESSNVLVDLTAEFTYSTYFGGIGSDSYAYSVVDSEGDFWVAGSTASPDFPTTTDAYNRTYGGNTDVFVLKVDGRNGSLIYSTFIGGSHYELPQSIGADPDGNIWICGETGSSNFPTTSDAYNSTLSGLIDMFILKLSSSNGSILYSSYIGGTGAESAMSMSFDSEQNLWTTGITDSDDFPMTPSSLYPVFNGTLDAVVFQLSKNGTTLLYSTYLGGTDDDRGYGLLVDSSDDVWVAGTTDGFDFPTTSDAYKNTTYGGTDIILLKLASDGSELLYSSYFGGSDTDNVMSIALDSSGNIWGTGSTSSTVFPTTPGAYDSSYAGSYDCVVFQFASNGSLLYSTYLGGSDQDHGRSISVDRNNAVWVSGDTSSATFPITPDAFNETYGGYRDIFLLSLAPNGTTLYYSTFLGGSDFDVRPSLAMTPDGRAWMAGQTRSDDFPTTENAFNRSLSGSDDVFVASFTVYSAPSSPINLSAIESVDETVVLLWEQPEYDGNLDVSSYRVYRNTTSGHFETLLEETTYEYFVDTNALPDTTYHYVVTAVNSYGESFASNEVTVNIPDATPPTINHPQDITYTEGDLGHFISWTPADTNPASFYIARNGVMVISGAWLGNDITLNVDLLPEGLYAFNCTVVDQVGNRASDVVIVVVEAGLQPTTTTTTSTTTTQTTTGNENGGAVLMVVAVGGGTVGVVLLLVILGVRRELNR